MPLRSRADFSQLFFNPSAYSRRWLSDPDRFVNFLLAQQASKNSQIYVFIDEAQSLPNIGLFVKYIYDQRQSIKFILSGSASLDIREKIKEPLTGRKIEFYLSPLTLGEIVKFNGFDVTKISGPFGELDKALNDYLLFGGYPEVVLLNNLEEKRRKLKEITESYILKDLTELFEIHNQESFRLVANYLGENIGAILSKEGVSKLTAISKYEIEKCLIALEKGFVVSFIRPFARNRAKELIHRPKIYFEDNGIRNALLNRLDATTTISDQGQLFENVVFIHLKNRHGGNNIKYWRTNNQTEVDFIVEKEGHILAIEAKNSWPKNSLPRNLMSFKHQYGQEIEEAKVISRENFFTII
ncbi:ATP-binding protein [Candidatus Saganbacteria bacterium]|nr:ATP-binding protein [Candidatus Saganbacteria bacterium]